MALRFVDFLKYNPQGVSEDFLEELKQHYSDAEIVEMGFFLGAYGGAHNLFAGLGVGWGLSILVQGFHMLSGFRFLGLVWPAALITVALALLLAGSPAHAQEFFIPGGFTMAPGSKHRDASGLRELIVIRPEEGPFAELTAIHLHEVTSPVDDPQAWLRDRIKVQVGDPSAAKEFLESPDSPFEDPAFDNLRKALPELFKSLNSLGELPLGFCDEPTVGFNAEGSFDELYCVFDVGPLRRYHVMRLQEVDGDWYFTEIRTMNERRLRHLLGIANSFKLKLD